MPVIEIKYPTLDARIRMFRAGEEVDCFAIVSNSHVVIVDTFSTPEEALEMMEVINPSLKTRELLVINTHQHYDHAWGNFIFAADGAYSAPIVAHQNSKAYLEQQHKTLLEMQAASLRFENVKIIPPTQYFAGNFIIKAGDLTLEFIEAFGHSGDQVAIWIPEIETLLPADALEFPFPELEFGKFSALMNTFGALKTLNPK
jgi:glyoxylase-like metal-dependent hydrolase (beta-lactamase superfamily II)